MRIGDWLVQNGYCTEEDIQTALELQQSIFKGRSLGQILIDQGIITSEVIRQFLEETTGVQFVDAITVLQFYNNNNIETLEQLATLVRLDSDLLRELMIRYKFVICDVQEEARKRHISIAIVPPIDNLVVDTIKRRFNNTTVTVFGIIDEEFNRVIDALSKPEFVEIATVNAINENKVLSLRYSDKLDVNTYNGMLSSIFSTIQTQYGFRDVSDIHFVPFPYYYVVRIRYQGILLDLPIGRLPISVVEECINKVKVIAEMDIAERRRPQDGQMFIRFEGNTFAVRVATIGAIYDHEILETRLLNRRNLDITLTGLGMIPEQIDVVRDAIVKPFGIIITSGPTGAGKTTTLYTLLQELYNMGGRNIVTIEDPVEYNFPGIIQVQTNPKAELTFTNILRSILRMDPDIILLGEIRDLETMHTALDAALSGHLVLSTLHANTAAATIARFLNMGADSKLLASALNLVIAQRLIRRWNAPENTYDGRTGLFEIAVVNDKIREAIARYESEFTLHNAMLDNGMLPFDKVAQLYVDQGITTQAEIERVLGRVAHG